MRRVLETLPTLHEAVADLAHTKRVKIKDMTSILLAYALERQDDAIAAADRLLTRWEQMPDPVAPLRIVRVVTDQPNDEVEKNRR